GRPPGTPAVGAPPPRPLPVALLDHGLVAVTWCSGAPPPAPVLFGLRSPVPAYPTAGLRAGCGGGIGALALGPVVDGLRAPVGVRPRRGGPAGWVGRGWGWRGGPSRARGGPAGVFSAPVAWVPFRWWWRLWPGVQDGHVRWCRV